MKRSFYTSMVMLLSFSMAFMPALASAQSGIDPALVFQHAQGRRPLVRGEKHALKQLTDRGNSVSVQPPGAGELWA
jgi:hypothetical protein